MFINKFFQMDDMKINYPIVFLSGLVALLILILYRILIKHNYVKDLTGWQDRLLCIGACLVFLVIGGPKGACVCFLIVYLFRLTRDAMADRKAILHGYYREKRLKSIVAVLLYCLMIGMCALWVWWILI